MNKLLFFLLISFLFTKEIRAQFSQYIVFFKNKATTTHSLSTPAPFLSQRAIERRTRQNIAIDSTDLPVPRDYIDQIAAISNVTVLNVSRWLNAISIQTTDANAIAAINALTFVSNTSAVAAKPLRDSENKFNADIQALPVISSRPQEIESNFYNYGGNSFNEIHLHNGEFLHNIGLRGQGITIAILDGGFFNYTDLDAFDSVNTNGQVLGTWDFVDREPGVAEDHTHGMMCFSVIAANIPGAMIGKAPKAAFHLFRTEDVDSEYPVEEFNWACGAERADSVGADIISSSLGYGYNFSGSVPDYPYSDLNGDITMAARAADLAAKKGILVFNSAGNSGTDNWHFITTPADGDSVVAVGAVSAAGEVGAFSSYGPSADGRIKPDVASVGVGAMVQSPLNRLGSSNGTSFACPNMAGLATCLWQGFPEVNNMRIVRALKEAGSIYQSPNDRIGYGIPDMKKAFITLLKEFVTSTAAVNSCTVQLTWTSKDVSGMKYEVERKTGSDTGYIQIAEINSKQAAILTTNSYQVNDPLAGLATGTISYRIRQVLDTDPAAFTAVYIDTTEIVLQSPCGNSVTSISIAPNPVIGNSSLIIETVDAIPDLSVLVYNTGGKLMMKIQESKAAGRAVFNLPVQQLSQGHYILKVMAGNKVLGKTSFLKM